MGLLRRIGKRVLGRSEPKGELEIEDLVEGDGKKAVRGKSVGVHYRGTLEDGTEFDSCLAPRPPFFFLIGAHEVIQGWDQGLIGMKVGGKRRLKVPPHLAYGRKGSGPIGPNATLIFEVELVTLS